MTETLEKIERTPRFSQKTWTIMTFVKLGLMLLVAFLPVFNKGFHPELLVGPLEIFAIFILSQSLPHVLKPVTYVLTAVLWFISLINDASYFFAGNYVTLIMWQNIQNYQALGSMVQIYIIGIILLIILVLLPQRFDLFKINSFWKTGLIKALTFVIVVAGMFNLVDVFKMKTPISEAYGLKTQLDELKAKMLAAQKTTPEEEKAYYAEFERENIPNGTDINLGGMNVIIINAEGFSNQYLDSKNGLGYGLTPNLDAFANQSINMKNYFNHTAATYHGLRGQMYSSYQFLHGYEYGLAHVKDLLDTDLVSFQDILRKEGYTSTFFNAEPNQVTFTTYLQDLSFDNIVTADRKQLTTLASGEKVVSDKLNLQLVLKEGEKLQKASDKPFLIETYTFGTHVNVAAQDQKPGVTDTRANTVYSLDVAFGDFWTAFQKSSLAKDTIVVFTTDHATYPDPDYKVTFHDDRTTFVSDIPLFIWYPGVTPKAYNVKGKNSLSLTPTLLDLMGYENHKNYFLGNSLYTKATRYSYRTDIMGEEFTTKRGIVKPIVGADQTKVKIYDYFNIATDSTPDESK